VRGAVLDPRAIKIHIDGNCWENPGGSGGLGVRVDYGCDIDREAEVVEYRGYIENMKTKRKTAQSTYVTEGTATSLPTLAFPTLIRNL
jgi:ribonuclease HI